MGPSTDELSKPIQLAIDACRNEVIDERLLQLSVQRTAEKVDAYRLELGAGTKPSHVTPRRFLVGLRTFGLAASAAMVLILVTLAVLPTSHGIEWSQVQNAVLGVDRIKMTFRFTEQPHLDLVALIESDGSLRIDYKDGLTQIFDSSLKKGIAIDPETKTGWDWKSDEQPSAWEFVERILKFETQRVRQVGSRIYAGQSLSGLEIKEPSLTRVWVENETRLPRLVEQLDGYGKALVLVELEYPSSRTASYSAKLPEGYANAKSGIETPFPREDLTKSISSWNIVAGQGIGPIRFGDSIAQVEHQMGKPSEKIYFTGDKSSSVRKTNQQVDKVVAGYPASGLVLEFDTAERLTQILAEQSSPSAGHKPYPGSIDRGVKLGDSFERVVELYGKPEFTRGKESSPSVAAYESRGVFIGLEDNKATVIAIGIPK